jgi:membrane-bound metal-dependent hydrolase YbcI (DUF457 family)
MLPTGHIAGGYLLTKGVLQKFFAKLNDQEIERLSYWGAFFGFLPDIDTFYSFYRSGGLTVDHAVTNHRMYFTHTPFFWVIPALLIITLAKKPYQKAFGVALWIGTWSHLLLDSIEYGLRWLWPFSNERFAIIQTIPAESSKINNFFEYWFGFLGMYRHSITFYLEIVIIIAALVIAFRYYKSNSLKS